MKRLLITMAAALALGGCGRVLRGSVGPTAASGGRLGGEAAVELGTHTIGSRYVAEPVTLRIASTVLSDGTVEGTVGVNVGLWGAPPQTEPWNARATFEAGLAFGNREGGALMRGALTVGRGHVVGGGSDGSRCSGEDKAAFCYHWERTQIRTIGLELGFSHLALEGDASDWRATAALVLEDITTKDIEFH